LRCLDQINHSTDTAAVASLALQYAFAERWKGLDSKSTAKVQVLHSIEEALVFVRLLSEETDEGKGVKVHAFVTGSVHLVGRTLGVLEGGVDAL